MDEKMPTKEEYDALKHAPSLGDTYRNTVYALYFARWIDKSWTLTNAGRAALERYEAKHGESSNV